MTSVGELGNFVEPTIIAIDAKAPCVQVMASLTAYHESPVAIPLMHGTNNTYH
jgi:hypothetical protein